MDCFSAESEFIDSLDFLSPPVKRIYNSRETFGSAYEANDVHLLRGLRNKFARRLPSCSKNSKTIKANAESSTSLILKKTSERKILEQYSILSYTSLQHPENDTSSHLKTDRNQNSTEKPLIKVTVIPKTDQVQTAKLLRKRRYIQKRVQSTASNHENSVQTKNVYLIVAGRRREKIYEIKTTGSAKFSTDHDSFSKDEEIPIKELSNFKHLIQSLNMDRKKRKEKKEKPTVDNLDVPQQTSFDWKGYPDCEHCVCANDSNESPKKSRVRIFGQFGISEDDKYVLRYGATVNDKQVLSDVAQLTRDFSPVIATTSYGTTCDDHSELQKDSCIQADFDQEIEVKKSSATDIIPSKESQGTQVNFNVQVAMTKGRCPTYSDKKIQCSCTAVRNRSDYNTLKDCQSPLVIISVYPKPSPEDIAKTVHSRPDASRTASPARIKTYTSNQLLKTEKTPRRSNIDTKRIYKSPPLSRSSSPIKKPSRPKVQEEKIIRAASDRKSPDRQKALRAIKEKIQEKDKLKQDMGTRRISKFNTANGTQMSRNLQNVTVSNATQSSNRNHQLFTSSDATQVSGRIQQNYTVSNATQYSNDLQSLAASNGMQCVDSLQDIAPIKHSKNVITSSRYPITMSPPLKNSHTTAYTSNATQVPKGSQHFFINNATQVSKNENFTVSNATQVSRNNPNFIATRVAKNQETFTSPKPFPIYKNEQTSRGLSKIILERGTNTDQARTKKALIETYTKKLTEQMNQKDFIPSRYDNSKVTVNIDGDREYYDVLFNQDKVSTDVTIRKTLKDIGSQKGYEDPCATSFENLMYLPECTADKEVFMSGNKSPNKSMSNALYNNPSDDELPKRVSRLTIRDSLEISHRREDKSNMKNTQTCFTAQLADNLPDETEFLAPIKHFTGDDCSICDPIERDKQIRELLGVNKTKLTYAKTKASNCEQDDQFPYQCIYRQECKKSQVTEINFEFQKLCPCFNPHPEKNDSVHHASVSVQCPRYCPRAPFQESNLYNKNEGLYNNNKVTYDTVGKCCLGSVRFNPNSNKVKKTDGERFTGKENSAIYQQLILNRNIQVFLQVDQFSKQKPIILSRKQYDKVKKTIQKTICKTKSSHDKRKKVVSDNKMVTKCDCGRSQVSVGEVRKKKGKDTKTRHEKEAQTDVPTCCTRETCKKISMKSVSKSRSRKTKPIIKHDSTDHSRETSSEKVQEQEAEQFHAETQLSAEGIKVTKRRKSQREHKPKRKVETNVEVYPNDQYTENTSPDSDEDKQIRHTKVEPKVQQIPERSVKSPRPRHAYCNAKLCPGRQRVEFEQQQLIEQQQQQSSEESSPEENVQQIESPHQERYAAENEEQPDLIAYEEQVEEQIDDQPTTDRRENEVKTFILFNAEKTRGNMQELKETDNDTLTRKTMSSMEIRYASVAYMKQVAYSSTDVGAMSDSSIAHVNSFHTIFRGHRKSATPNLGTSAYSLYSEEGCNSDNKSAKYIMEPRDSKPKKPFLRRLMSCLVMRSTRDSELKLPTGPAPELPSVNSSVDSYHISTSLGAVEVSSSIYDTSASFYSNHTILPVNSKIKRGFFSSVRGFLTNRKS